MNEKWQRWNKEELAILKKCYPNMSREELLCLLPGRTWRAIGHQAEVQEIHRPRYGSIRSEEYLAELHTTLSTARTKRTSGYAPFIGKHHSVSTKLCISVSNLYTRGHSIADIAKRNFVSESVVKKIIEERDRKKK